MDERSVSVKVAISAEDYCAIKKSVNKKATIISSAFISFGIMSTLFRNADQYSASASVLLFFGFSLLAVILLLLIIPPIQKKLWMKQYRNDKLIGQDARYVIKPDGLELSTDTGIARYPWDKLSAHQETKDYFSVFTSETTFFYITKRDIATEADKHFVRECLLNLPVYRTKTPIGNIANFVLFMLTIILVAITILLLSGWSP